jgi:hypothetical protein
VPAVATLIGVAVPLALCLVAVLWAGQRHRDDDGDEPGGSRAGCDDEEATGRCRGPRRVIVAVVHPDGGVAAAVRE